MDKNRLMFETSQEWNATFCYKKHRSCMHKASVISIQYLAQVLTNSFYSCAWFECSGYSSAGMYCTAYTKKTERPYMQCLHFIYDLIMHYV